MVEFYYYTHPTQVRYYEESWKYGIAFKDFIINAETGKTVDIDILFTENNLKYGMSSDDSIVELDWINFTDKIQ